MLLFRLGIIKESRGQAKDAAAMLQLAADSIASRYPEHPLNQSIAKHAGRALYQIDDYDHAMPYLEKAAQQLPNDFMVLLMLGQMYRKTKLYPQARTFFERALAAKPPEGTTPDPRRTLLDELIIITYELKDMDACGNYINIVLTAWPHDPVANTYRANLEKLRFQQKQHEAIEKIVK